VQHLTAVLLAGQFQNGCERVYGLWTAGQRIDPNTKSDFVWKSSSGKWESVTYTNWYPGKPDFANSSPESCLAIWPDHHYQWNDAPCSLRACFVCEYEAWCQSTSVTFFGVAWNDDDIGPLYLSLKPKFKTLVWNQKPVSNRS